MGNVASSGGKGEQQRRDEGWSAVEDQAVLRAIELTRRAGGGTVVVESRSSDLKLSIEVAAEREAKVESSSVHWTAAGFAALAVLVAVVPRYARAPGGGALDLAISALTPTGEDIAGWWNWKMLEAVWSSALFLLARRVRGLTEIREAIGF
eukprot:scaffold2621_cov31-Tisochrysis_lutea.AAC.14